MLYWYGSAYFYVFHIYAAFWSKSKILTFFSVCVTGHKTDLTQHMPDCILVPIPKRVKKHSNPRSATKFLLTWGVQIEICQLASHSSLIKWPSSLKPIVLPGAFLNCWFLYLLECSEHHGIPEWFVKMHHQHLILPEAHYEVCIKVMKRNIVLDAYAFFTQIYWFGCCSCIG
jgi:hypothetical protein